VQQVCAKSVLDRLDPKCAKYLHQRSLSEFAGYSISEEARMLTAVLLTAIVLPALMLGHIAHEELQSQRAYRRARSPRHADPRASAGRTI
jgi:hypothetical protein